jgi:DinB superfamily
MLLRVVRDLVASSKKGASSMEPNQPDITTLFLDFSRNKLLQQYWPRLRSCVEPLTGEQLWWRPNEACNSIGNLVLHLNGNVRQWLVASFNRQQDQRDRPAEFKPAESLPASALLARLDATMQEASEVLSRLTHDDLVAPYEIQGYKVRGLDAVYQVVEHFGLHYGQILYIVKSVSGADLGFYRELNKTGRVS